MGNFKFQPVVHSIMFFGIMFLGMLFLGLGSETDLLKSIYLGLAVALFSMIIFMPTYLTSMYFERK